MAASLGSITTCSEVLEEHAHSLSNDDIMMAADMSFDQGHLDVMKLLLNQSIQRRTKKVMPYNERAHNLLWRTFYSEEYELGCMLLYAGVDGGCDDSATLIHLCSKGNLEMCKVLLQNGARADAQKSVALVYAITNGHRDVCELLLTSGARPSGESVIQAARNGHDDILHLLVSSGADINAHNGQALVEAVKEAHYSTIKLLVSEYDVKVNIFALAVALSSRNFAVCDILLFSARKRSATIITSFEYKCLHRLLLEQGAQADVLDMVAAMQTGDIHGCYDMIMSRLYHGVRRISHTVCQECPVCYEVVGEDGSSTSCGHVFHTECIRSWMRMGRTSCPCCRTDLS